MTKAELATLKRRSEADIDNALAIAQTVIEAIRQNGDEGVVEFARKFDYSDACVDNLRVTDQEFAAAREQVPPKLRQALEHAFANIQSAHTQQMPDQIRLSEIEPGVFAGEKINPIPRVGLYVPRGRGAFPSMMLMLTIPAQVAGVPEVVICTPPAKDGSVEPASLLVAEMAGYRNVYRLGGVQAIAAMALGTATIGKVDKITGPCSVYGAAAKRLLYGTVDVGLPAGPSESIVLADETADPRLAALDLLIEAEHGADSAALLVTPSPTMAHYANLHIMEYLKRLPEWRRNFCEEGLAAYGGILLTPTLEAAIDFINDYAPEHLELLVQEPFGILGKIQNAGEILLGPFTPSCAATYSIGINAVLPTGGFARSYSAVSVFDFLKRSSVGYLSREGFERIKTTTLTLAEYEEFPAHALAIQERELLLERDREPTIP